MLATQVAYWNYREAQRHNYVTEDQGQQNINELIRHDKVSESIGWGNLSETIRHDKATESIGRTQAYASMLSARSQQVQAAASMKQARASLANATTNRINASTNVYNATTKRMETKSVVSKNRHSVVQGYLSNTSDFIKAGSSVISSVGNLVRGIVKF